MFDFWYEFKLVVPKGYTRFLGKISELTDMGVEVHFFIGNHDIWCGDYLEKECGVTIHREPLTCEIYGKEFSWLMATVWVMVTVSLNYFVQCFIVNVATYVFNAASSLEY